MYLKCQNFYTLGVEEYFTKSGYFTWRVSDCEELVGANQTCQNRPLNSLNPLSKHILLRELES